MNFQGIDPTLAAQFSDRELRLLFHPRSLARGRYRRGTDETFTAPVPLHMHRRTIEKENFILVEILDAAMAFEGPWVSDVE